MDGFDLRLLSLMGTTPAPSPRLDGAPASTVSHHLGRLTKQGILFATGQGRARRYGVVHPKLAAAARAALSDRPKLGQELATPSFLVVLSSLHPFDSLSPREVSGLNPRTWTRTLDELRDRNLVLDSGGTPMPNSRLGSLQWWIQEYRDLYAQVPKTVATPMETRPMREGAQLSTMAYRTLHQWGVEAAWRLSDARPGPETVGFGPSGNLAPFRVVSSNQLYAYFGPRNLDAWDETFLYCEAERNVVHDPRGASQRRLASVSDRAKALFFWLTTAQLVKTKAFRDRARFYHNEELVEEALAFHRAPHAHALWMATRRLRTEFGIEEGFLARAHKRLRHRT